MVEKTGQTPTMEEVRTRLGTIEIDGKKIDILQVLQKLDRQYVGVDNICKTISDITGSDTHNNIAWEVLSRGYILREIRFQANPDNPEEGGYFIGPELTEPPTAYHNPLNRITSLLYTKEERRLKEGEVLKLKSRPFYQKCPQVLPYKLTFDELLEGFGITESVPQAKP